MNVTVINRVPHILFIYWVIKIASTTLGETGADMFSMTFDYGYETTIAIFTGLFALLLGIKLLIKRYDPTIYWLVFTATAIVGTAISDYIDRTLGLGYATGSVILTFALILILALWKRSENSINVEYIVTAKAEIYYWLAFLIANTLGTAAGDFLADDMALGFAVSAAIITGLLVIITLLHFYTKISKTILFWLAFVLTRPFGATFGDFLTKPIESGGLNLGTIGASIFFAIVLIISIHKETRLEKSRAV
jgi:uncharacterized membrane-anchored protein